MDLFDWVATESKLHISDLRLPQMQPMTQSVVETLPAETYSIQEWRELIAYVFGEDRVFLNQEEAKAYYLSALQEGRSPAI